MSLGKEIQRAQAKIESLQAKENEMEAMILSVTQERDLAQAAIESAMKASEEKIAKMQVDSAKRIDDLNKAGADLQIAHKDLTDKHSALIKELEDARQKLTNPAFADASAKGEPAPVADGGQAVAEEKKVSLWQQYYQISDPVERSKFWNANEKELRTEAGKIASK